LGIASIRDPHRCCEISELDPLNDEFQNPTELYALLVIYFAYYIYLMLYIDKYCYNFGLGQT
jgi:hypothetical protein